MKSCLRILFAIALVFTLVTPSFLSVQAITSEGNLTEHKSTQSTSLTTMNTLGSIVKTAFTTTTKDNIPPALAPSQITNASGPNERNIYNWDQLYTAMNTSSVNILHIQADFYNTKSPDWQAEDNINIPMRPITIYGNGHTIDFRGASFYNNSWLSRDSKVQWEINHLTMYGRNFYGPIKTDSEAAAANAYGAMVYDDVTYIGSQLTASYRWTIDFRGHIENHSVNSYISPFDNKTYSTQQNQVNIEAKDVVFRENNYYMGTTENAGVFRLGNNGKMSLENNTNVTMTSNGNGGEFGTTALYLEGELTTGENAKLTINTRNSGNQYGVFISGRGNGITLDNSAEATINSYGDAYSSIYMESNTMLLVKDDATLNVLTKNKGTSTNDLIRTTGSTSFIIAKNGTFNAVSDGIATHSIIDFGSNSVFRFADAKKVNLQFTNEKLSYYASLIKMSSGSLDVDVQEVQAWNSSNISGNSTRAADFHWTPMFSMITTFSGARSTVKSASSVMNQMRVKYMNEFRPEYFSRLMYLKIPDVDLEVTNHPNDLKISPDSQVVKGIATPGALIRVTGDSALETPSLPSGIDGSNDTKITGDYSTRANSSGYFEVKAQLGKYFTASSKVNVYAFLNGKTEEMKITVADRTAPTAEGIELAIVKGDPIPNAKDFLINIQDTNPTNSRYSYDYKIDYSNLSSKVGTHDIILTLADEAYNIREILAKLSVMDSRYEMNSQSVKVLQSVLKKYDTEQKMKEFLLKESKSSASGLVGNKKVDLTNKILIEDLNSIMQYKAGKYTIQTSVKDDSLSTIAKGTDSFTVNVLNDEAVAPTNPENPGSGAPSEKENDGTGQTGVLKLDYVPSNFDFGEVKFGFDSVDTKAVKTTSSKQWLQVSDNRADEDVTNWSVQVAQNHALQSNTGKQIKGATITIPKGKKYNQHYNGKEILLDNGPLISNEVAITTTPTIIFKSDISQDKMKDISTNVWNVSDVTLHVPGNQQIDFTTYTNTINWTLVTEP